MRRALYLISQGGEKINDSELWQVPKPRKDPRLNILLSLPGYEGRIKQVGRYGAIYRIEGGYILEVDVRDRPATWPIKRENPLNPYETLSTPYTKFFESIEARITATGIIRAYQDAIRENQDVRSFF